MRFSLLLVPLLFLVLTVVSCSSSKQEEKEYTDSGTSSGGSSSYSDNGTTFKVTVSSGKYYIDGTQTKSLTLKKEYTYYLDSTDSTTDSHPLFIGTTSTGGSYTNEYTSGVTNSRTTTGTLTFTVSSDSPSTLYYNCGNHTSMGGSITIL